MSQPKILYPKAKAKQEYRIQYIEDNLLVQTQAEMAKELGVVRETISRDMVQWADNGGLKKWGIKEFFELYGIAKLQEKNKIKLLDRVITLLCKLVPPSQHDEIVKDIAVSFNLDNKYSLDDSVLRLKPVSVGVSDGVESTE